jgi:hypothetical protein
VNTSFFSRVAAATFVGLAVVTGAAGASVALASPALAVDTASPGVFGDPGKAAQYWAEQSYGNDCVLMAVADVVGQITGHKPSEQEIIEIAQHTPSASHPGESVYKDTESDGADSRDIVVLLAHYGIHATTSEDAKGDAALNALKAALGGGHAAMVSVSAGTMWDGTAPKDGDHEVVVTGVDTVHNVVHLNDSGTGDGRDEQVPLAVFMKAWSGGDFEMTLTADTVK